MPRRAANDPVVTTRRVSANSVEQAKQLEYDIECDLAWISERASPDDKCLIYSVLEEITKAAVYATTTEETKQMFPKLNLNIQKVLHG